MPAVQALLSRTRAGLLIFAAIAVVRRVVVSSAPLLLRIQSLLHAIKDSYSQVWIHSRPRVQT